MTTWPALLCLLCLPGLCLGASSTPEQISITFSSVQPSKSFMVWCFAIGLAIFCFLSLSGPCFARLVSVLYRLLAGNNGTTFRLGSVYLSLLGGTVRFKGLEFTSANSKLVIRDGSLVLRWWMPSASVRTTYGEGRASGKQCRVEADLRGFSLALYNRANGLAELAQVELVLELVAS